jgi:hypothetical protein
LASSAKRVSSGLFCFVRLCGGLSMSPLSPPVTKAMRTIAPLRPPLV